MAARRLGTLRATGGSLSALCLALTFGVRAEESPLLAPPWVAEGEQLDARFGRSVAAAGDVNGDGRGDVIVGAFKLDAGAPDVGAAFLYLGADSGLGASADWIALGEAGGDEFARWVAGAGDVNLDGYDDVLVGSNLRDAGRGAAYLYLGSPAGPGAGWDWRALGLGSGAYFGTSPVGAGDLNGDGYPDVAVGATGHEHGGGLTGAVFVFTGSASGLGASPAWTLLSVEPGWGFGRSISAAGDVNGDGYGDLIVGAPGAAGTSSGEGAAYLYLGSDGGPSSTPDWSIASGQVSSQFGESVAGAGDVNGDGFDDLLVGAPLWDNGQGLDTAGAAFAFLGSAGGPGPVAEWMLAIDRWGFVGYSVAAAGDVDGDGYADALIGVPYYDQGHYNEGAVFLFRGGAGGLGLSPVWHAEGDWPGARLGDSVSSAGDVNGDGLSDVVAGAHLHGVGSTLFNPGDSTGRAYVHLSSGPATAALCGDLDGDGAITSYDALLLRESLADPAGSPLTSEAAARCDVGAGSGCDLGDAVVLLREAASPPLPPGVAGACAAAGG